MLENPSLRILIVEDHHDSRVVLQRLLTTQGHVVHVAETCAAAMRIAKSSPFEIVIGDVGLPDGDGCELMRKLRHAHGVACIALSGYDELEHVQRAVNAGICLHLCKPIAFQQLLDAIEQCRPKRTLADAGTPE
jgi:DNA-binding response OmpR family regulator